jgi:hypothetical protein
MRRTYCLKREKWFRINFAMPLDGSGPSLDEIISAMDESPDYFGHVRYDKKIANSKDIPWYYVYAIGSVRERNNSLRHLYIGSRTAKYPGDPYEVDSDYLGSPNQLCEPISIKEKLIPQSKVIISLHDNRYDAYLTDNFIHNVYNVRKNPFFWNIRMDHARGVPEPPLRKLIEFKDQFSNYLKERCEL